MELTEKQVTRASGAYPQTSDEALMSRFVDADLRVSRNSRWTVASFLSIFVAIFAMFGAGEIWGEDSTPVAVTGLIAFLTVFLFGWFAFGSGDLARERHSLKHELDRRGIWPE